MAGKGTKKKGAPAAPRRRPAPPEAKATGPIAAAAPADVEAARHKPVKVPFPKKNKAPTEAEFVAHLPLALGKRFEAVRAFLKKQKRVTEELYYYGPRTGWAYRYMQGGHSVATVMIHDERLLGIVSLDQSASGAVDWGGLSPVGRHARQVAHGSPALLWIDLPLDGTGAADFKVLLKSKLKALPRPAPTPPPPPAAPRSTTGRTPPPPPPAKSAE